VVLGNMRRSLAPWLALALLACADDPVSAEPTDEQSSGGGESRTEQGSADEAPPEPERIVVSLPDRLAEPGSLPLVTREIESDWDQTWRYELVQHPDPDVRRRLNAVIESLAGEMATRGYGRCRVPLSDPGLVSVWCPYYVEVRGGIEGEALAAHAAIEEGEVRPLDPVEVIDGLEEMIDALTPRCDAEARRRDSRADAVYSWEPYEEACSPSGATPVLTPTGLRVYYRKPYYYPGMARPDATLHFDFPYEELRERIRGPLARVLGGTAPPAAAVAEADADAWAVSAYAPESELVQRWAALSADEASALQLKTWRGGLGRLVSRARPTEALADRLGVSPQAIALDDDEQLVPLRWVRTTSDLNLRASSAATYTRARGTLPRGAILVALGGEPGQRGSWARTVTALGRGWVAARYLAPIEGCVPERPEGFGVGALAARFDVLRRRRRVSAAAFVRREGRGTHVALRVLGDDCALGDELLAAELPGHVADLRITRTAASGGETLVVIGAPRRDGARYVAYRLGRRAPIWNQEVAAANEQTVRLGEEADGQWFPITFQANGEGGASTHRLRWTGQALEEVPAP